MTLDIKHPAIFLLGAEGAGKSTLGNMLLEHYSNGLQKFPISDIEENLPKANRTEEININGKDYSIVDTIGVPESDILSDRTWNKLKGVENKAQSGVALYIFVLEGGRLTQYGLILLNRLFMNFSNSSRTIIVFTKVRKSLMSSEEMKKTFNKEMLYFLRDIGDRWIVMPNSDIDNSDTIIEDKVEELKNKIIEIENVHRKANRIWKFVKYFIKIFVGIVIVCIIIFIIMVVIGVIESHKNNT